MVTVSLSFALDPILKENLVFEIDVLGKCTFISPKSGAWNHFISTVTFSFSFQLARLIQRKQLGTCH